MLPTSFSVIGRIFEKLTGWLFLVSDLSPQFLKTGTAIETFQKSEKLDSLKGLLKRPENMCEKSGSPLVVYNGGDLARNKVGLFQIFNHVKTIKKPLKLPFHKKHHFLR